MKERNVPMRRCIGCMESKEKNQLIRIAAYEGKITVDTTGKAKGRGAYLCKFGGECLEKAYKRRALERSLNVTVTAEQKDAIFKQLTELNER